MDEGFGVGVGLEEAFVDRGVGFSAVSALRVEGDFGRGVGVASTGAGVDLRGGLKKLNHPLFFGLDGSATGWALP